MLIKKVRARKIKDSRGEATIEVHVNGSRASSPSGKSTGKYETKPYFKSLDWNVNFLNKTKFNLEINSFSELEKLESFLREKLKFRDVKKFGANALFAFECAVLKALARSEKKELWQIFRARGKMPVPVGNVVGGGLHAHNKSHPTFQEFLLIPEGKSFKDNYEIMKRTYREVGKVLRAREISDEGAWEISMDSESVFELLSRFEEVRIGSDVAGSSFFKNGRYLHRDKNLSREEQIFYLNFLSKKFKLFYLEDPLQEEDFSGFARIKRSAKTLVVGDDLTATQVSRLKKALKVGAINAMIIKPNQNGSLLELREIFELCRENRVKTVLSHRSGETKDDALADLAVGFGADFIKAGVATKWREVKLKRLVRIEKMMGGER